MVVSPRARRRVLEIKLKEKNQELKELCVREAEIIGFLPPETPIEPGESPPSFTPKNTLFMKAMGGGGHVEHKSHSIPKDEDTLASLEQECRIQTGISEAAFGLANDTSMSKTLRRKHRLMYQHSQHRISELETRINLMRRTNNLEINKKHKNNINPMGYPIHDMRDDRLGVPISNIDEVDQPHSLVPETPSSMLSYQRNYVPPVPKHQIQWSGHYNHVDSLHPISQSHAPHATNHSLKYKPFPPPPLLYSSTPDTSSILKSENVYKPNLGNSNLNPMNPPQFNFNDILPHGDLKRFGSLDRRRANYNGPLPPPRNHRNDAEESFKPHSNPNPHKPTLEPDTVLLPNQMYPENSIMRTQSLINVRESQPLTNRMVPWYEVADQQPLPPPPSQILSQPPTLQQLPSPPVPPILHPVSNLNVIDNMTYHSTTHPQTQSPTTTPIEDVVVPYESPKNQTVVQAGKFQPYREISKPFEMSDFYKYSTKFKKKSNEPMTNTNSSTLKSNINNNNNNNNINNVYIKTKENIHVQHSPGMISYNPLNPSNQQHGINEVMSWIQNEKPPEPHNSTFV